MSYLNSITPSIVLFIGLGLATSVSADNASHQQAVQKLFELTGMQQKIEESVDNVLALQLAQSPELRKGMGLNGYAFFKKHYTVDQSYKVIMEHFKKNT